MKQKCGRVGNIASGEVEKVAFLPKRKFPIRVIAILDYLGCDVYELGLVRRRSGSATAI
jgi:hypothetical protein